MIIVYHLDKTNGIADVLGLKTMNMGSVTFFHVGEWPLDMNVKSLANNL